MKESGVFLSRRQAAGHFIFTFVDGACYKLSMTGQQPLKERYPEDAVVPAALAVSALLLIGGLSLPLMHVHQRLLWKSWQNSYSVWTGVLALWHQQEYLLAAVIFFFSMAFPFAKLLALGLLWYRRLGQQQRDRVLHWLGILGKWSMLDVFAVAILIVLVKLGPLANVQPRSGVYVFAAAIVASMLTSMYVERLARKPPAST